MFMKTILLVRHSIPQKINVENAFIPLSKEGINQAKQFFELPIFSHVNDVYSSTYLRPIKQHKFFQIRLSKINV